MTGVCVLSNRKKTKKKKKSKKAEKPEIDVKNMSDDELWEIVGPIAEELIKMKASKNTFVGFDYDDIAQEIRAKCFLEMRKIDTLKGDPKKFLNVVTERSLFNLKRDNFVQYIPPCLKCKYFDSRMKATESDWCTASFSPEGCKDWNGYMLNYNSKIKIKAASSYDRDSGDFENTSKYDFKKEPGKDDKRFEFIDLDSSILDILPPELIPHYKTIRDGNPKRVPIKIRRKIQDIVREIL
jgi:hypothetical protein